MYEQKRWGLKWKCESVCLSFFRAFMWDLLPFEDDALLKAKGDGVDPFPMRVSSKSSNKKGHYNILSNLELYYVWLCSFIYIYFKK